MSALDSAHAALALGCPTLLVARMSASDPRARHRGISHHTLTVLDLLLEPVSVAMPAAIPGPLECQGELRAIFDGQSARPERARTRAGGVAGGDTDSALQRREVPRPERIARHDWRRVEVDLAGYAASGLPTETMGRGLSEDPLFFAAALAGGAALAGLAIPGGPARRASAGERATSGSEEGAPLADAKLEG
jgi:hypothetical protein